MRRFLIWLGRIFAVVLVLAIAAGIASLVLNAGSARRARKLAEREPSTYLVGQFPTLILDHVRVIDGAARSRARIKASSSNPARSSTWAPVRSSPQ
jgi:hypothetical protein